MYVDWLHTPRTHYSLHVTSFTSPSPQYRCCRVDERWGFLKKPGFIARRYFSPDNHLLLIFLLNEDCSQLTFLGVHNSSNKHVVKSSKVVM